MSTLTPFGGPVIVRDIDPASGDDADWTLASAIPAGALFTHPGGPIHLTFDTVDANGNPVAPATADFDFELRQVVGGSVFAGVPVVGAVPLQRYAEGQTPDGGYAVRVVTKANMPAGASFLRVRAQAGVGTSRLAIRTGTIAQLQALTSADVSVGDVAWSATHQRLVYVLTATASASTWAYKEMGYFRSEWSPPNATKFFVPWTNLTESASTDGSLVSLDLPYAGEVKRVSLTQNSGTVVGVTDIDTHFGVGGADPSGTLTETQEVTIGGLNASEQADFVGSSFAAGSRMSLGVDVTTDPAAGLLQLAMALEFVVPAA